MEWDARSATHDFSSRSSSSPDTLIMQTFSRLDGPKAFGYDVFLSFRGIDTRYGFTGFLHQSLNKRGFRTFMDDRELHGGDKLTPKLFEAIEESKVFVIVLSKNYASSSFCLAELLYILCEFAKGKGRRILTVSYHSSPSDVLPQTCSWGGALDVLKDYVTPEGVDKWIDALSKESLADFSSWHLQVTNDKAEHLYIDEIVREVSKYVASPIGLHRRVDKVQRYLNFESDGVCMVGICGNPGIGKTTLARTVYCFNAGNDFDCYCFIDKVGEYLNEHELLHLINSKIIGDGYPVFENGNEGMAKIKGMLSQKKVFLVLEDVDNANYLKYIVELSNWLGFGSKIIITARDKCLLEHHGIKKLYDVEGFNAEEAYELLSVKTSNTKKILVENISMLDRARTCAAGNPFFLEVIGSHLSGKSPEDCKTALNQYESIPKEETKRIPQITFYALEKFQQTMLLDIALQFKEQDFAVVEDKLRCKYDVCPKKDIRVLLEKSLLKIDEYGQVTLHALTQDMVRDNVPQEDPGEHSKTRLSEEYGNRDSNLPQVIEVWDSPELEQQ